MGKRWLRSEAMSHLGRRKGLVVHVSPSTRTVAPQTTLACDSFKTSKNDFSTQCVMGDSVPQDTAGADILQGIKRRLCKTQIDPLTLIKWGATKEGRTLMDKGHAALRAASRSGDGGMVHGAVRILNSSLLSGHSLGSGRGKGSPKLGTSLERHPVSTWTL